MIERIIENWLDKASEKAFQIPFCYMLMNEGHTIIHMTRHCGMEHGKDIISIDKTGRVYAYQLKGAPGSKIKLKDWQQDILGQVNQLVFTPVTHPSIKNPGFHEAYFVTNGGIEEEVSHAIQAFNHQQEQQNLPYRINTIVDGELKIKAKKLTYAFLPADLKNFNTLLEFILEDGKGVINKRKLAGLLESILTDEKVSTPKFKERINSAALITAIATSNYTNQNNHFAIYESWLLYIASLLNYVTSHQLARKDWKNEYQIGEQLVINALENLWDELQVSRNFLSGNPMEDVFFLKSKRLLLYGLMANLGIYHLIKKNNFDFQTLKNFIIKDLYDVELWGESAMPFALSVYWFLGASDAAMEATAFLSFMLEAILIASQEHGGIIGPYYDIESCLSEIFAHKGDITLDKNQSFFIEGFINLLALSNQKELLARLWPAISHFIFKNFNLTSPDDFFNWHNDNGKEVSYLPKFTKDWQELLQESSEAEGAGLPLQIRNNPLLYPLLLTAYPHRSSPEGIRWFNKKIAG